MERTNFEKLQVYQLSEKLADGIWNVVGGWNSLLRTQLGSKLFGRRMGLEQILQKVVVEGVSRIIAGSFVWRADRYTRPSIAKYKTIYA